MAMSQGARWLDRHCRAEVPVGQTFMIVFRGEIKGARCSGSIMGPTLPLAGSLEIGLLFTGQS